MTTLSIKMNDLTGTIHYTVTKGTTSVKVTIEKLVVKNERKKTDKAKSYSASYAVTFDGQSVYSHSGSWPNNHTTTVKAGASKSVDRADTSATKKIRLTATMGVKSSYKEASVSIPELDDDTIKPKQKVTGLTIERSGSAFTAKWKVPSGATSSSAKNRFTGLQVRWSLTYSILGDAKDTSVDLDVVKDPSSTSATQNLSGWKVAGKSGGRDVFHPINACLYAIKATVKVRGFHKRSGGKETVYGDWCGAATYSFAKPKQPDVTIAFDGNTKAFTATIASDEGKGAAERYSTTYRLAVRQRNSASKVQWNMEWPDLNRSTKITVKKDLSPYLQNMAYGDFVQVLVQATAKGMRGDSSTAEKSYTVAMPRPSAIKGIKLTGKNSTSKVNVEITPGKYSQTLQLQRRHGETGTPEDVPGAVDNADCKMLYDTYGAVWPSGVTYDEKVYYRVKGARDGWEVFSAWVEAKDLYVKESDVMCTGKLSLKTMSPTATGCNVKVSNSDSSACTGTEVSWSDRKNAWESSEEPSSYSVDYSNKETTRTFAIPASGALEPGKKYYVRARRFKRTSDGKVYYGKYAEGEFTTASAANDSCDIINKSMSVNAATGKATFTVTVGYNEDNDNTGTELSWSTSKAAWSGNGSLSTQTYTTAQHPGAKGKSSWGKEVTLTISDVDAGDNYYVSARRYLEAEGADTTYTKYCTPAEFIAPSAENDKCKVLSVQSSETGDSATATVLIDEDNENTGTELQWSMDSVAWYSNVPPESLQATWPRGSSGRSDYPYRQVSYLRNLTPSRRYYIRARRYLTLGSVSTYGPWSDVFAFDTRVQTAANDKCCIVDHEVTNGGTGARLVIGWTEDNANDGTEVSWSSDDGAWISNEGPQTMQATWDDKDRQSTAWAKTQTVNIRGLSMGTTYYVKARRYLSEGVDGPTYSPYSPTVTFSTPDVLDDPSVLCGIVSLDAGEDGKSAVLVIGWDGNHTGCEVTWSDDPDAWESSAQPNSQTLTWRDNESKSQDWSNTSTFYLAGLEEGTTYYVRARSYYESDQTVWSDYTADYQVTPVSAPTAVSLSAPQSVARGEAIELYWTVESELDQVEWHVHEVVGGVKVANASLANGTGSLCHATVPADRYGSATSVTLYVSAGCGGGLADSDPATIGIADAPSCEAECPATLTAQPLSFEAYSDNPTAVLLATLSSLGVTVAAPDGDRDQLAGDVIWTSSLSPSWEASTWGATALRARLAQDADDAQDAYDAAYALVEFEATSDTSVGDKTYYELSGGVYSPVVPEGDEDPSSEGWYVATDPDAEVAMLNAAKALEDAQASLGAHPADGAVNVASVTLPAPLPLMDGGAYLMTASAVEGVAGLSSPLAESRFTVEWAHQAPAPSPAVEVVPDVAGRTATISLAEPSGWAETDVYDVYRKSGAGYDLIASGLSPEAVATDRLAPYGRMADLAYRVCSRTADGDTDFADYTYEMPLGMVSFDWPGGHVELPYNLELSESWDKSFESRAHVDGTVNGYYDRAVERKGSWRSDMVRVGSLDGIEAVKALAEHPGAVFCRTQGGDAFMADVQVSGLDTVYSSAASSVSLNVTALSLSREYMLSSNDIEEG